MNTSANQKNPSSTSIAVSSNQQNQDQQLQQHSEIKREKVQDNVVKTGGRVRIKLGTNKQNNNIKSTNSSEVASTKPDDSQKSKNSSEQSSNSLKEDLAANYSHLRRITRRSQRSVQTIINEDEESMSSMTSIDENQQTTSTTNNSDNAEGAFLDQTSQQQSNATSTNASLANNSGNSSSSANNNGINGEPIRRYKRRKGENSDCPFNEHLDLTFGYQNYKLPNQNSFELFRNIRKQVDKKLRNLSTVHPKTPHGFKDYMMTRGAYLLDGNKLGNGTNLYMNAEGGLHTAPMGKYHALTRHNKVSYSVPNRAKVPLGIPVNSPLYNLFIEQEKERHRMRMQHIKEREKLTLAAEQEMIRVHNQAAMTAIDQSEPFSACTMLKHQEIYNYMDADGLTILSNEDAQQERPKDSNGDADSIERPTTKRFEPISPPSSAVKLEDYAEDSQKDSTDDSQAPDMDTNTAETLGEDSRPAEDISSEVKTKDNSESRGEKSKNDEAVIDNSSSSGDKTEKDLLPEDNSTGSTEENKKEQETEELKVEKTQENSDIKQDFSGEASSSVITIVKAKKPEKKIDSDIVEESVDALEAKDSISGMIKRLKDDKGSKSNSPNDGPEIEEKVLDKDAANDEVFESRSKSEVNSEKEGTGVTNEHQIDKITVPSAIESAADSTIHMNPDGGTDKVVPMEHDEEDDNEQSEKDKSTTLQATAENSITKRELILSDDDRKTYNKEIFLAQLQAVDDKWDKVRYEMLIRHRNEAESLYAVQKLEWEWKTKEIGACDVRTTPIIDTTLVPKLNIYTQDY